MVVVSINYRLGVLGLPYSSCDIRVMTHKPGYLSVDALSSTDLRGVSGNYGITDHIVALEWVQNNIAAFGGNPQKITVFGQSSGGTNIFALLSNPKNNGLFQAAISLSGRCEISLDT